MEKTAAHGKALNEQALSALCLQLHELLGAGISPDDSFDILRGDAENAQEKALFSAVLEALDEGLPLAQALERAGGFPTYLLRMIEVGEKTGTLDTVLRALADFYDREHFVRESVRGAVVYPAMMAVMMVAILGVLTAFVLPVFSDIFAELGLTLSPAATLLLRLGRGLAGVAGILVAVGLVVGVFLWREWQHGRLTLGRKTALARKIAVGRFASAMALMLHSGLNLDESLRLSGELTEHPTVTAAVNALRAKIDAGDSLSEGLEESRLFSGYYLRMLRVGERAGRMGAMMDEVAQRLSAETGAAIDSLIARIEPTMVLVLSCGAGLILLSVMLPLLGVLSAIG